MLINRPSATLNVTGRIAALPIALEVAKECQGIATLVRDFISDPTAKKTMGDLLVRLIDTQSWMLQAQAQMKESSDHALELERKLAECLMKHGNGK